MTELTDNEPVEVRETHAITVRFTFRYGDWCEAILNETTGTFTINADAGTYSYSWRIDSNLGIKPPFTLLRGINGFGVDYLTNKLCGYGEGSHYDENATRREVLKEALERFGKEGVEGAIEDVNFDTADTFMYTAPQWLDDPHFFIQTSPTRKWVLLHERYLPAIKSWVAKRVEDEMRTMNGAGS